MAELKQDYAVTYHEFSGGHEIPREVAGAAFDELLGTGALDRLSG